MGTGKSRVRLVMRLEVVDDVEDELEAVCKFALALTLGQRPAGVAEGRRQEGRVGRPGRRPCQGAQRGADLAEARVRRHCCRGGDARGAAGEGKEGEGGGGTEGREEGRVFLVCLDKEVKEVQEKAG